MEYLKSSSSFILFREKLVLFEKVRNSCDTFLPQTSPTVAVALWQSLPGPFSLFYICISFTFSSIFLVLHELYLYQMFQNKVLVEIQLSLAVYLVMSDS